MVPIIVGATVSRVLAMATLLLLLAGAITSLGVDVPPSPTNREPAEVEENPEDLGHLGPSPVTVPIETV